MWRVPECQGYSDLRPARTTSEGVSQNENAVGEIGRGAPGAVELGRIGQAFRWSEARSIVRVAVIGRYALYAKHTHAPL